MSNATEAVVISSSSTIRRGQEPFESFQPRALAFAQQVLWPGTEPARISVAHMRGGFYNRVTGMTKKERVYIVDQHGRAHQEEKIVEYILRTPRYDGAKLDREVAALSFVHQHTSIQVPHVIEYDDTDINVLKTPYMVQRRLPGTNLYRCYTQLSHERRCHVAWELGQVFHKMLASKSDHAGHLVFPPFVPGRQVLHRHPANPPIYVETHQSVVVPYDNSIQRDSTFDTISTILAAKRLSHEGIPDDDGFTTSTTERLEMMNCWMHSEGLYEDVTNSLIHLDLGPHNVLVDCDATPDNPFISAVLDWDNAIVGPSFLSCAPPAWIWAWVNGRDEDERTAGCDPPTKEARELKGLFERAAGPEYMRFAYDDNYRLARRLYYFAANKIECEVDKQRAMEMLAEWETKVAQQRGGDI